MQIFSGYYLYKFDRFKSNITGRKVQPKFQKEMPFQTKINKVKKSVVMPIVKSVAVVGFALYFYHLNNEYHIKQLNERNFNLYAEQRKIYREARWICLRRLLKGQFVGEMAADFYLKRMENLACRLYNPARRRIKIVKSTQIIDLVLPLTLKFGLTCRTLFYNERGDLAYMLKKMKFSMLNAYTLIKPKPEDIRILKLNNRIEMKHEHLFGKFSFLVNDLDLNSDINFLLYFSKNSENREALYLRGKNVQARLYKLILEQPVDQEPFPITYAELYAQYIYV